MASVQKKDRKKICIDPEKQLTGNKLDKKKDLILLLDGSVDFLILLCEKYEENVSQDKQVLCRISDVLDSAYWLFQDFMVERTEIIFDAVVLDYVAKDIIPTKGNGKSEEKGESEESGESGENKESKFSIECKIRFFEDQFLDYSLEEFRDKLFERINDTNPQHGENDRYFIVMAEITPGRMDMTLRLFPPRFRSKEFTESKNMKKWYYKPSGDKTFRDQLIDLLEPDDKDIPPYIDRVEITVTKRPPQFGEKREEHCQ